MRRTLKRQGLPTTLRRLREATPLPAVSGSSATGIRRLCAAYEASRRYYLPVDHCLIRALALYRHAQQRGHDARLVFGVQLHPFSAHSWVEQDDLILDDRVDHVRRFKPILVL
ncbi:lasso peptide biosynthesis B2 protein [Sphingobium sp. CR2-8]|uniref:lasso peptide biosynthesis B2 protein n=1 Tax=Sphingobium sp. CR2-8 TaxID=1306534 RepID=UPI003FA347A2